MRKYGTPWTQRNRRRLFESARWFPARDYIFTQESFGSIRGSDQLESVGLRPEHRAEADLCRVDAVRQGKTILQRGSTAAARSFFSLRTMQ